jgi:hypothetical protein
MSGHGGMELSASGRCHMPICITIIDALILTIYTNDAYLFDTGGRDSMEQGMGQGQGLGQGTGQMGMGGMGLSASGTYAAAANAAVAASEPYLVQQRLTQRVCSSALSGMHYKGLSRFCHDFGMVPHLLKEAELFG